MPVYASVQDFRQIMSEVPSVADSTILTYLERATAFVSNKLGFEFGGYLAVAAERRFESNGGRYLHLPYYEAGSLTAVARVSGAGTAAVLSALTDYEAEYDDHTFLYREGGWRAGRYSATAKWGYGLPPADIVEVTLELATNMFIGGQGGQFSDVVGVEGAGAVGYNRALTNRQRDTINDNRLKYGDFGFA